MLNTWHSELEYDLAALGIDLLDFWRGTLSPRRLEVLIRHLPPTSATKRAMLKWHHSTEDILADVFDVLAGANWQRAHSRERPVPYPKPYPRPGDELRRQQEALAITAQLEAFEELEALEGGV